MGAGSSIAAIKGGESIDTSMGFTPLAGVMMGTRSGDIDPAIVPFLMKHEGLSADEIDTIMNKKSGILGLYSGKSNDMREIEEGYSAGREVETRILHMVINRILKYIGSYAALMNGVDVIVMAGGVLERMPIAREMIAKQLERFGLQFAATENNFREQEKLISTPDSRVAMLVVPTNEEYMIAKDTAALVG